MLRHRCFPVCPGNGNHFGGVIALLIRASAANALAQKVQSRSTDRNFACSRAAGSMSDKFPVSASIPGLTATKSTSHPAKLKASRHRSRTRQQVIVSRSAFNPRRRFAAYRPHARARRNAQAIAPLPARTRRVPIRVRVFRRNSCQLNFTLVISWFYPRCLPEFQCRQTKQNQHDRDDPEPHHNLCLFPAFLLEVMMQGRHAQDTSPFSIFFLSCT